MNETLARETVMAVVAQIVTAWTAYPLAVESDNRTTIDQANQVDPYLKIMIDFLSAEQADMADAPLVRNSGQIQIHAVVKAGGGWKKGSELRDFVRPYFNLKSLNGLQCQAAEIYKSQEIKGWEHVPILINFYFHEVSS